MFEAKNSRALPGTVTAEYKVSFQSLPENLTQLRSLDGSSLLDPAYTAALTIAALSRYPSNKEAALDMLAFLQGPRELSVFDKQFLADRFRDKDYVPRSYFWGAVPNNNYAPTEPFTITLFENPYSRSKLDQGYLTLWVCSGGADSPRQITLRNKPSTGQWFLWEQFLLSDIRKPIALDPWA